MSERPCSVGARRENCGRLIASRLALTAPAKAVLAAKVAREAGSLVPRIVSRCTLDREGCIAKTIIGIFLANHAL